MVLMPKIVASASLGAAELVINLDYNGSFVTMKLLSPAWGGGQTFHNTATEVGKFPFAPFLFLNLKCENGTFINKLEV